MIGNTRFNPTTNGPLHLGHLYVCMVNEAEARASGGKFIVRFDDNQHYWQWIAPQVADPEGMKSDLAWAGVKVDAYTSQKELAPRVDEFLHVQGYRKQGALNHALTHAYLPECGGCYYPFVPDYTAEKVALDFLDGITVLIRGSDLLTEFSLYNYFCKLWDLPIPRQVFLPRLDCGKEVSKTAGNHQIRHYRNRPAQEVLGILAKACLIDPAAGWRITNVKPEPRLEADYGL